MIAKKQICVVGLKNNQRNEIESECSGIADLRFVDSRRSVNDLPICDHVVLMTRFIKHRWTRARLGRWAMIAFTYTLAVSVGWFARSRRCVDRRQLDERVRYFG